MRLQKFLAHAGVCSRRAAEALIRKGLVRVDGSTVSELGFQVEAGVNVVEVSGKRVELSGAKEYWLLNKPVGFLTTVQDPFGRPTVMDIIGSRVGTRLYPVGRLDMDSQGLLLLTNDGELANRLLHPRHKVEKSYHVRVKGRPSKADLQRLRGGVEIEGRRTLPCRISVLGTTRRYTLLEITLKEGRKRQIRMMMAAVGHPVVKLTRVRIGPLELAGLAAGEFRRLSGNEVMALKKAAGLNQK